MELLLGAVMEIVGGVVSVVLFVWNTASALTGATHWSGHQVGSPRSGTSVFLANHTLATEWLVTASKFLVVGTHP